MSRMRMLAMGAMMAGLAAATYNGPPLPAAKAEDNLHLWKRRKPGGGLTRSNGQLTDDEIRAMAEQQRKSIKGNKRRSKRRRKP